jgi:hypothetical protein
VMPRGFEFLIQTPQVLVWTTLADDAVSDSPKDPARGEHRAAGGGACGPAVFPALRAAQLDPMTTLRQP